MIGELVGNLVLVTVFVGAFLIASKLKAMQEGVSLTEWLASEEED